VGCDESSCVQTFGYIKSNEDTPKYFKIGSDGENIDISTAVGENTCSNSGDSGKLTSSGLCLDGTHVAALDSGNTLATDGQGIFTGTTSNVVAVNVGANIIALNKILDPSKLFVIIYLLKNKIV